MHLHAFCPVTESDLMSISPGSNSEFDFMSVSPLFNSEFAKSNLGMRGQKLTISTIKSGREVGNGWYLYLECRKRDSRMLPLNETLQDRERDRKTERNLEND